MSSSTRKEDGGSDQPAKSDAYNKLTRLTSRMSFSHITRQSIAWRLSAKNGYKMPMYQNTYRLEPYLPFNGNKADNILSFVMNKELKEVPYNSRTSSLLCQTAAEKVINLLNKTSFDRVKYMVIISIFEKTSQGILSQTSRLWDSTRDACSFYSVENNSMYATGLVAAVYYE